MTKNICRPGNVEEPKKTSIYSFSSNLLSAILYRPNQKGAFFANLSNDCNHGLRTPREEIAFTARPKIHSHSQIFRYGGSIFCLPHRPIFSDIFDLCLHWVSVVRALNSLFCPKQVLTIIEFNICYKQKRNVLYDMNKFCVLM